MKKKLGPLLILAGVLVGLVPLVASADAQETCPEGDGWVKVEGLSGLSYTFDYDVPEGKEIVSVENCMKVGSHDPVFGEGFTVENTTLFNSPGGATCTAAGVPHTGCALQSISHASFKVTLRDIPDEGSTTTLVDETTTTTLIEEESTTTLIEETTTTAEVDSESSSTTVATTVTTDPVDPVDTDDPEVLPFTGIEPSLAGLALALLASGLFLLRRGREVE